MKPQNGPNMKPALQIICAGITKWNNLVICFQISKARKQAFYLPSNQHRNTFRY